MATTVADPEVSSTVPWYGWKKARERLRSWVRDLLGKRADRYQITYEPGRGSYCDFTNRRIVIDPDFYLSLHADGRLLPSTWGPHIISREGQLRALCCRAVAAHEAGHVLFTDTRAVADQKGPVHGALVNILEDERIERLIGRLSSRSWMDLRELNVRSWFSGYKLQADRTTNILNACLFARYNEHIVEDEQETISLGDGDDDWLFRRKAMPLLRAAWETHSTSEVSRIAEDIMTIFGFPLDLGKRKESEPGNPGDLPTPDSAPKGEREEGERTAPLPPGPSIVPRPAPERDTEKGEGDGEKGEAGGEAPGAGAEEDTSEAGLEGPGSADAEGDGDSADISEDAGDDPLAAEEHGDDSGDFDDGEEGDLPEDADDGVGGDEPEPETPGRGAGHYSPLPGGDELPDPDMVDPYLGSSTPFDSPGRVELLCVPYADLENEVRGSARRLADALTVRAPEQEDDYSNRLGRYSVRAAVRTQGRTPLLVRDDPAPSPQGLKLVVLGDDTGSMGCHPSFIPGGKLTFGSSFHSKGRPMFWLRRTMMTVQMACAQAGVPCAIGAAGDQRWLTHMRAAGKYEGYLYRTDPILWLQSFEDDPFSEVVRARIAGLYGNGQQEALSRSLRQAARALGAGPELKAIWYVHDGQPTDERADQAAATVAEVRAQGIQVVGVFLGREKEGEEYSIWGRGGESGTRTMKEIFGRDLVIVSDYAKLSARLGRMIQDLATRRGSA